MAEPPRGGWEHAYTVMIIIFFGGKLGIVFWGEASTPQIPLIEPCMYCYNVCSCSFPYD